MGLPSVMGIKDLYSIIVSLSKYAVECLSESTNDTSNYAWKYLDSKHGTERQHRATSMAHITQALLGVSNFPV